MIHRLEGGRVAETDHVDNLTALVQLGHWEVRPPDDPPEEGAFCAVWVPPQAPAVDEEAPPVDEIPAVDGQAL